MLLCAPPSLSRSNLVHSFLSLNRFLSCWPVDTPTVISTRATTHACSCSSCTTLNRLYHFHFYPGLRILSQPDPLSLSSFKSSPFCSSFALLWPFLAFSLYFIFSQLRRTTRTATEAVHWTDSCSLTRAIFLSHTHAVFFIKFTEICCNLEHLRSNFFRFLLSEPRPQHLHTHLPPFLSLRWRASPPEMPFKCLSWSESSQTTHTLWRLFVWKRFASLCSSVVRKSSSTMFFIYQAEVWWSAGTQWQSELQILKTRATTSFSYSPFLSLSSLIIHRLTFDEFSPSVGLLFCMADDTPTLKSYDVKEEKQIHSDHTRAAICKLEWKKDEFHPIAYSKLLFAILNDFDLSKIHVRKWWPFRWPLSFSEYQKLIQFPPSPFFAQTFLSQDVSDSGHSGQPHTVLFVYTNAHAREMYIDVTFLSTFSWSTLTGFNIVWSVFRTNNPFQSVCKRRETKCCPCGGCLVIRIWSTLRVVSALRRRQHLHRHPPTPLPASRIIWTNWKKNSKICRKSKFFGNTGRKNADTCTTRSRPKSVVWKENCTCGAVVEDPTIRWVNWHKQLID